MSYDKVKQAEHFRVGIKQTQKSVEQGQVTEVYIAEDAERRVVEKLITLCREKNVPITYVDSMKKLGEACGIEVGSSAVAILK